MFPPKMTPAQMISFVLMVTALSAAAAPKIALVRIKDIYTALPSTAAIQKQIKDEQAAIMKNERAEQLRKIIGELQALQAQLSDKTTPPDEATSRTLARSYEIKRQEAQTLQQEFENYKTEQEKIINRKMVAGMRSSLNRIEAASQKISKERGFDAVFDSSGDSNTGVPFILFSKNATDLTPEIEAALKGSDPATAVNPPGSTTKAVKSAR
ncbi:MAG: OmpH family outer membrane protein [Luteolibacter sp.]